VTGRRQRDQFEHDHHREHEQQEATHDLLRLSEKRGPVGRDRGRPRLMPRFDRVFTRAAPHGERKSLEPFRRNSLAAVEAESVFAGVQPLERVLDVLEGFGFESDQRVVQVVDHVRQHCAVDMGVLGGHLAGALQPVVHCPKNLCALPLERLTQTPVAMGFTVFVRHGLRARPRRRAIRTERIGGRHGVRNGNLDASRSAVFA